MQSKQSRRRFKQEQPLEERLVAHAARLREEAVTIPPGTVRDAILKRAEQAETAAVGMSLRRSPESKA